MQIVQKKMGYGILTEGERRLEIPIMACIVLPSVLKYIVRYEF